jgi:hypothetical protein
VVDQHVGRFAVAATVVTARPASLAFSSTSERIASTSSVGLMDHWMSSGASFCSCLRRDSETGLYELIATSRASYFRARSIAKSTALVAVSEPSVPTATLVIISLLFAGWPGYAP